MDVNWVFTISDRPASIVVSRVLIVTSTSVSNVPRMPQPLMHRPEFVRHLMTGIRKLTYVLPHANEIWRCLKMTYVISHVILMHVNMTGANVIQLTVQIAMIKDVNHVKPKTKTRVLIAFGSDL